MGDGTVTAVWFAVAAVVGALLRDRVNRLGFGWRGTLAVNVVGSFLLGLLLASDQPADVVTVLGTGGCGALTTFSMFALEAVEADGAERVSIVVLTVAVTLAAAAAGYALG